MHSGDTWASFCGVTTARQSAGLGTTEPSAHSHHKGKALWCLTGYTSTLLQPGLVLLWLFETFQETEAREVSTSRKGTGDRASLPTRHLDP